MSHKLTHKHKKFAGKTAKRINKDYPGQASVINGACYITDEYLELCQKYVLKKCAIKPLRDGGQHDN